MCVSRVLAAVLATALLSGTAGASDPAREYLRGVRACEDRNWASAVPALRAAIAADPGEGTQKLRVTGVVFEDYFPWAYLGLALEKLGETAEARTALEESERQGAVRRKGTLAAEVSAALARLAMPSPPAATVTFLPSAAPPTAVPVATPASTSAPAAAPGLSPAPRASASAPPAIHVPPNPPAARPLPTQGTTAPGTWTSALESGIVLHFRGRYDEAIAALEPVSSRVPVARLFLAYSIAGKALLAERPDPAALEAARRELRKATADGASSRPGHVSPHVLEVLGAEAQPRRIP